MCWRQAEELLDRDRGEMGEEEVAGWDDPEVRWMKDRLEGFLRVFLGLCAR